MTNPTKTKASIREIIKYHLRNRGFGKRLGAFFAGVSFLGAVSIGVMLGQNAEWYWVTVFGGLTLVTLGWIGNAIKNIREKRCDIDFEIDSENMSMTRYPVICIGACDLPRTQIKRSIVRNFSSEKRVMRSGMGPTRVFYDLVINTNEGTMTVLSQAVEEDDIEGLAVTLNNRINLLDHVSGCVSKI
jgi:hypothetical protein